MTVPQNSMHAFLTHVQIQHSPLRKYVGVYMICFAILITSFPSASHFVRPEKHIKKSVTSGRTRKKTSDSVKTATYCRETMYISGMT